LLLHSPLELLLLPLATWATGAVVSIVVAAVAVESQVASDVAAAAVAVSVGVAVAVAGGLPLSLSACRLKDCNIIYYTFALFLLPTPAAPVANYF